MRRVERQEDLTHVAARALFGVGQGIASTVYGTVVVMATLTAAYPSQRDPWKLAAIVAVTVLVLWIAHVYAHALSRSITHSRPTLSDLGSIAHSELGILLAAALPLGALLIGSAGLVRESAAIWLALATGLGTLTAEGVRYARLERLGPLATIAAVGLNLAMGLFVVALKVVIAH